MLADHGLAVAVQGVGARAPLPVEVDVDLPGRFPLSVEGAAYFVVCEAVANAIKHGRASQLWVSVSYARGRLRVEVCDDGIGIVNLGHGTGLRGLADRVEALDGRLRVTSGPGRGTRVRAVLPCG